MPKKTNNKICLILFEDTFTSLSKIKSQKGSQIVGIKVFLFFFA